MRRQKCNSKSPSCGYASDRLIRNPATMTAPSNSYGFPSRQLPGVLLRAATVVLRSKLKQASKRIGVTVIQTWQFVTSFPNHSAEDLIGHKLARLGIEGPGSLFCHWVSILIASGQCPDWSCLTFGKTPASLNLLWLVDGNKL